MEPASSTELMLRTYGAFLLGLAVVLCLFAGVSLFAYLTFLYTECLSPPSSQHPSSPVKLGI